MLHDNELINIEEDTILGSNRGSLIRRFTLTNRANRLTVGLLSSGGSVCSCLVDHDRQEIVLQPLSSSISRLCQQQQPPPKKSEIEAYPPASEWSSHVLGPDSLMLTTSSSQCLTYQLTTNNELVVTGKLRQLGAQAPFYVNLHSINSMPIDGHILRIDSLQGTEVTCTGDDKYFLLSPPSPEGVVLTSPDVDDDEENSDDGIGLIQDTIYSVTPPVESLPDEGLVARLSYEGKSLTITVQSIGPVVSTPNTPPTCLKLRIRIKTDGVSIMPVQMMDFKCTYKIRW